MSAKLTITGLEVYDSIHSSTPRVNLTSSGIVVRNEHDEDVVRITSDGDIRMAGRMNSTSDLVPIQMNDVVMGSANITNNITVGGDMLVGTGNAMYTSYSSHLPPAFAGKINGVSITALNRKTIPS